MISYNGLDVLRRNIDGTSQMVSSLSPNTAGNYIGSLTIQLYEANKSLLLAKAWVGKLQGTLGGETPYKNDGKRSSVADIEPTDARVDGWVLQANNHIGAVDSLRQSVTTLITLLEESTDRLEGLSRYSNICKTQVFVHLTEARFHLGFELGRIYDLKDQIAG